MGELIATDKFKRVDKVTAAWEGGYANHPKDPGGPTMRGVTQARYDSWRRARGMAPRAVRLIADEEVLELYVRDYWAPVHGDELPVGLDLSVYDYGVNSGPARSAKDLQRVLGVGVDGDIGEKTLAAARVANVPKAVKSHCGRRLGFVQSLKIWETFGRGWGRRVADVQAKGVAWALAAKSHPSVAANELEAEADRKRETAKAQKRGAATTGAGGAGAVVTDQATSNAADWLLTGIGIVVLLVAGYLVIRMILNRQQQAAYAREAAAMKG